MKAGAGSDAVVSSRIRLARNLDDSAFPGWAGDEEVQRLWDRLRKVIQDLRSLRSAAVIGMETVDMVEKDVLIERHLISREMAGKGAGSGVILRSDERISIMVNEEDHLRIQAMSPGLDLPGLWKLVVGLDSEIESRVEYAFSSELGYLSACPTNVGTGMRASVMLHLPGLVLMNEIKPVVNGISRIGMAVRGLWGEGTEASGDMFQVSNQVTLGEDEETIIKRLERVVLETAAHEMNARRRMMQQKENILRDRAGRALGILSNAHLLNSRETLAMLSHLRLGIDMGIVKEWDKSEIDRLFILIQPGHLQKTSGRTIGPEERDYERARLVRKDLARREKIEGET